MTSSRGTAGIRPTGLTVKPRQAAQKPAPAPIAETPQPTWDEGAKLHIGCGPRRLQGWINADVAAGVGDVQLDLHDSSALPRNTLSIIYGCHVLEHCYPQDTPAILRRMFLALQPGGVLRLSVPDLRLVVANCLDSQAYGNDRSALAVIYGGDFSRATAPQDLHRQMFWTERLTALLRDAGFVDVRAWKYGQYPDIDALADYATWPRDATGRSLISLNMEATKPTAAHRHDESWHGVDVSVLLGTVNRPQMLKGCVESIRSSLTGVFPQIDYLSYEIVVAYGTVNDDSLPWMKTQTDIVPVFGGITGAIDAFNRAYEASRGKYVCIINDDVTLDTASLATAIQHLDTTQECAGVVFQFDRGDGLGYRNEWMGSEPRRTPHPNQVILRRSACESVIERLGALWGDAEHRTDKTYGGDSALGAWCRRLGLRLDVLPEVTCRDRCNEANDEIRRINAKVDAQHSTRWRAMYQPIIDSPEITLTGDEWPNLYVPRPSMAPRRSPIDAGASLRVLHTSIWTPDEEQSALATALGQIGPYCNVAWNKLGASAVLDHVRAHRPDMIWAQVQSHSFWSDVAFLERLRREAGPECTLIQWNGDVRTNASQPVERWMLPLGAHFDLMLADNTTYPRLLKTHSGMRASFGYLACGVDLDLNPWDPAVQETDDLVFLGTNYRNLDGGAREGLLHELGGVFGSSLTVYGRGWHGSKVHARARDFVPQLQASAIMRSARAVLSMSLFNDLGRYSSDRLKRAMCSGAVVLVRKFPDMEGLGLRDGENCLVWDSADELIRVASEILKPSATERRMALRTAATLVARQRFTWTRVVEELLAIVRHHRAHRGLRA